MVSPVEFRARIADFYRFSKEELIGLLAAVLFAGFIFSFRDWGDQQFDLVIGLIHLFTMFSIAFLSFWVHLSCQKLYGLSQGYLVEFRLWWTGLFISLIFAFFSFGYIPLVLIGGVFASFMVRQRLGEFRYGFSYPENGIIAMWGPLGNLILAIFFAIGAYALPQNYFFHKGLIFNLIMAGCSLIPLPQLDGLSVYFGSRFWYLVMIIAVGLSVILLWLLPQVGLGKFGLITAVVIAVIVSIVTLLVSSEK
ncbi:hypothetical protein COV20_05195 [Candidatus Woesearchaeota archaeon CG10_big_fil_rev_8_21_14_0_10_45_16]|nr:MAG: hypothetical protein COV20_05195 [Candidatus Woesearchaeota archaeon CG10_big_fil_rev_8_21_14_0_10_45_16]